LWDLESGQLLRELTGHVNWINAAGFSPDGEFAISASSDNSLILWRIDSQRELLNWTLVNREIADLSCNERSVYQVKITCDENNDLIVTPYMTVTDVTLNLPTATPLSLEASVTPSLTPSPIATSTITPQPSATPQELTAGIGENRGNIILGSFDTWYYQGQAGDILTIRAIADLPARAPGMAGRIAHGLDTVIYVYLPDGKLLASNDDIEAGLLTDSYLVALELPQTGIYHIEVRAWSNETSGAYTLILK
jgi:WD40 repeat protein